MRYGIDIDGCLANFTKAHVDLINRKFNVGMPTPTSDWPTKWDYHKDFISSKQDSEVWAQIKSTGFWRALEPIDGALQAADYINWSRAKGEDIYFITSRPGEFAKDQTERWLHRKLRIIHPTVLIAPSDYSKGQLAKALRLDVFIDDKPSNCAEVNVAHGDKCRIFLVDRPYNRDTGSAKAYLNGVTRVPSVLAALEGYGDYQQLERAA